MSTHTASPTAVSRALEILRRHPITSYFVIAYAVTWLFHIPVVLLGLPISNPETHAPSLYILPGIAIGVTGTAFFMTAVTQGKPGVRRLLQRLTTWRVGLRWWAVAVLLIPATGIVIASLLGTPDAVRAFAPAALIFYPAAYAAHFIFGPLFEETGWRGFALPRMQQRFGPLKATIFLGLLWSAWHFGLYVPMWFGSGDFTSGIIQLGMFVVFTTSMTFLFTWLSNNTRASLLLCILLHGSVDGSITYLQVLADKGIISAEASATVIALGMLIACVAGALVLTVFTRGKLSYLRYQREAEALDLPPSHS
jgi:membrane protease YdiL (CAAX protease family)